MIGILVWGPRRAGLTLGITQAIAYAASSYLPAILAERMAAEMGVTLSFVFGAFSAALLLVALLGRPLGRYVDRAGGRELLIALSLVSTAGLVALALCQNALQLCAAWMVIGLGMALRLYDIAFAALVNWFGAEAKRSITGVTLIAGFASTIGWPLTAWMTEQHGWRGACLFWAAAHLLITLPLHLSLPPVGAGHRIVGAPQAAPGPRGETRSMALLAIAFAAMAALSSAVSAHLPPLLAAIGVEPAMVLVAAALVGPAQVAARLGEFTIARGSVPLALFGADSYGARLGLISIPGRIAQAAAPFAFALLMQASPASAIAVFAGLCVVGLRRLVPIRRSRPALLATELGALIAADRAPVVDGFTLGVVMAAGALGACAPNVGESAENTDEDSRSNRRPIELIDSPAFQRSQISARWAAE